MRSVLHYWVRHPRDYQQQSECDRRQKDSLQITKRGRSEERGEPALERPDPSEQRRLEPRTSARCLGDLEQQLSVGSRIAQSSYDAVVAIQLDGETEAAKLPPNREVPRHQEYRQRGDKKQERVMCPAVLLLVTDDISPLRVREREHPARQQHAGAQQSNGCWPGDVGDEHRSSVDDRRPLRAA